MSGTGILLRARDGYFFKDGRGWRTSTVGRAHTLPWPFPSTVLGALRTAFGRTSIEPKLGRALASAEWVSTTRDVRLEQMFAVRTPLDRPPAKADRMWPAPADAVLYHDAVAFEQLHPVAPSLATPGVGTLHEGKGGAADAIERLWRPPLRQRPKALTGPRWWPEADFVRWALGEPVARPTAQATQAQEPARRVDAHVSIAPETSTAEKGLLYSREVRESLAVLDDADIVEWAIAAQCEFPAAPPAAQTRVVLGGEGRLASLADCPLDIFAAPDQLLEGFGSAADGGAGRVNGIRLIAATPAAFPDGWLLPGFEDTNGRYVGFLPGLSTPLVLRAAFVGRPLHVSGWDMEISRPRPTWRLVPPGSAYFLTKQSGEPFTNTDAEKLWLTHIGERTHEGYGAFVPGTWTPDPASLELEARP